MYCDGPFRINFLTYRFPPNRVKWCAAEHDLRKTFGLTFDHELARFDPTGERKRSIIFEPARERTNNLGF